MSLVQRPALPALCLLLLFTSAFCVEAADTAPAAPSPSEEKSPERQLLPERSLEEANALERQLPPREQQQLQADSDTFLALWKPANSSDPEGVVIIVPGAGETADWPQAVGPLRQKLPDAAWGSLSVTLPDLARDAVEPRIAEPTPPPAADTASKDASTATKPIEQAASAASEDTDPPPIASLEERDKADATRIFARIDAALAFAQTQNARSIALLGHGTGAWWAARYLSEKQPPQVQKFIMVAAQTPPAGTPDLLQLVPSLKLATADIFYQDNAPQTKAALQRAHASKRLKNKNYSQVSLKTLPGNRSTGQEQLYRRVRGWLSPEDTGS